MAYWDIDTPFVTVATTGGWNVVAEKREDLIRSSGDDGAGIHYDGRETPVVKVTVYPGFSLDYVLGRLDSLRESVEQELREAGYGT